MSDYKRIAERLSERGLGAVDLAARTAANLPAILHALELAAAVERLKAWQLDDTDDVRKFTIEPDDASVEGFTAHLSIDHYDGTIDGDCASHESSLPAAINAALDAAEKKP